MKILPVFSEPGRPGGNSESASSFKASIEIPLEKNLFLGKRVGFVYGDAEKHFLRNISHKLDEIKL